MKTLSWHKSVVAVTTAWLLLVLCIAQSGSPVHAQIQDFDAPIIGLDDQDEAPRDQDQVFAVTVTDDRALESVFFHFRFDAGEPYQSAAMTQVGGTDRYTYTISAVLIEPAAPSIQYYIDARDEAGNRTLQGFAFDPIERLLIDAPIEPVATSETQSSAEPEIVVNSMSTTQKVVYGVLGVLVVGALIAGSSSDSGDSSTGGGITVPVTITSEPLVIE